MDREVLRTSLPRARGQTSQPQRTELIRAETDPIDRRGESAPRPVDLANGASRPIPMSLRSMCSRRYSVVCPRKTGFSVP